MAAGARRGELSLSHHLGTAWSHLGRRWLVSHQGPEGKSRSSPLGPCGVSVLTAGYGM